MNIIRPTLNGWQFARVVAVPVDARTCAKNRRDRTCAASDRRFSSDQAGRTSRYSPGSGRSPYHPSPNPSPLVSVLPSLACRDWCTSEWHGADTSVSIGIGSPW